MMTFCVVKRRDLDAFSIVFVGNGDDRPLLRAQHSLSLYMHGENPPRDGVLPITKVHAIGRPGLTSVSPGYIAKALVSDLGHESIRVRWFYGRISASVDAQDAPVVPYDVVECVACGAPPVGAVAHLASTEQRRSPASAITPSCSSACSALLRVTWLDVMSRA
jgi:hypothetical protein